MFVINEKCRGPNPPEDAYTNENKSISIGFDVNNEFEECLGIYQYSGNENNVINPNVWWMFFSYSEGDGLLSSYSQRIDLDITQSLIITINADSTEITGKIKDLNIVGGGNCHLGFPKDICISKGTFRVMLRK